MIEEKNDSQIIKEWKEKIDKKIDDVEGDDSELGFTKGEMLDKVISFISDINTPIFILKQLASSDNTFLGYYKYAYEEQVNVESNLSVENVINSVTSIEDVKKILNSNDSVLMKGIKTWLSENRYKPVMSFSSSELLFISVIKKTKNNFVF